MEDIDIIMNLGGNKFLKFFVPFIMLYYIMLYYIIHFLGVVG